ncbi:hypothetical protein HCG45_02405 [Pseudomonas fulva]|uniref:hypothetical protein n=1 Tax=Pseudomonas TaxID=286 RepID=UPI0011A9E54C|nr:MULTISPECIES: hypothetical protein [Pseudomonas]NIX91606.1 hypothetical protein [Pseudomonas fulva]
MYKLPNDFDPLLLSGCYLETISFGSCLTRFDFSRPQLTIGGAIYRVSFNVEGGLKYFINNTNGHRDFENSYTSAPLIDLLLKDVESVSVLAGDTLQILFYSGDAVIIEGDADSEFEAYSIFLSSGDIIVI